MVQPYLRAGAAETEITPPLGVEMCGYGPYEKRICTEVLDPLHARALWLESAGKCAVIVGLDLCTLDISIRNAVVQRISAQSGVPNASIMIAASHTHSGPAGQLMIGWGERDSGYLADLADRLVQVVMRARALLAPARIGICRHRIKEVGVNREQTDLGPTDIAAQLMRVDRLEGTPLAVLFNFGAHPVVRYPYTSRISADWPGLVAGRIKAALPGAVPVFLQGPCANVNGHDMSFERADVETQQKVCDARTGAVADHLSEQIIPALKRLQTGREAPIAATFRDVVFPSAPPDRKELQQTIARHRPVADRMALAELRPLYARLANESDFEVQWREARFEVDSACYQLELAEDPAYRARAPVQVLRIGEAAIVGWPGEIFVELGLELRQRSPFPLTFVAAGANHTIGYIPTPAAYESQGKPNQFGAYPVAYAPRLYGTLPFRADVGSVLMERTVQMLNSLSRQGQGRATRAGDRPAWRYES